MNSSNPPATAVAPAVFRARAIRAAVLVGFVWTIAALPFVFGMMRCPTAQLFQVPCPGCGMTRAFQLLVRGEVRASLAMHALAVPTALAQVALAVASIAASLRFGAPWSLVRAGWGRAIVGFVGLVMVGDLVFWLARALGAFGGPVPV
jgi:Protein of unknown function (DUF2752)